MRPADPAHPDRTWLALLCALLPVLILERPLHASNGLTADEFLASPGAQAFQDGAVSLAYSVTDEDSNYAVLAYRRQVVALTLALTY